MRRKTKKKKINLILKTRKIKIKLILTLRMIKIQRTIKRVRMTPIKTVRSEQTT